MNDDYLWNRSGEPDPEVERLERLLGPLRHSGTAPELPGRVAEFPRRSWLALRFLRFRGARQWPPWS